MVKEGRMKILPFLSYPEEIYEELIEAIRDNDKVCHYIDMPIQHINDTVLRRMNRSGGKAAILDSLRRLKEACPEITVRSTVIVGFPGETDALFSETYGFLQDRIRPSFIHVFPYSKRSGTRAAARKDQVRDSVKTARVKALEELSGRLHEQFINANRGLEAHVLFESTDRDGTMSGYTENYIRVERPYDSNLTGKIVEIEL